MQGDRYGHGLLRQRVAEATTRVGALLDAPVTPSVCPGPVVATGIGSSEAQARYVVWLLNAFTTIPARFEPLARFADPVGPAAREETLVVFSQGLSPTVRLALDQTPAFAGSVVFTAATEAGQRSAGRLDRAERLAKLAREGVVVVPFPIENEYTVLLRAVGPACGMAAAARWVAGLPGSRLAVEPGTGASLASVGTGQMARGVAELGQQLARRPALLDEGFLVLLPAPWTEFAQNLAYKWIEGTFGTPPALVELLQFAHGPFQQLAARPRPVWLLVGASPFDRDCAARAITMLRSIGIEPVVTEVPLATPWAALALELAFNRLVLDQIERLDVDQVQWPGHGLDDPLYQLATPHAPEPLR
jgi:hypothetical protein